MKEDLSPLLEAWPYEPGRNLRKVIASDGRALLQVRIPLGIEQYEMDGRPDGLKPYGAESCLDYQEARLARHRRRQGGDSGFVLDTNACRELAQEGTLYYYRYVLLFQLGDYARVIRDTARNLRMFDFVRSYCENNEDSLALEQYRPYIIRMHRTTCALEAVERRAHDEARRYILDGISTIRALDDIELPNFRQEKQRSLRILEGMLKEMSKGRPPSKRETLEKRLKRAIKDEQYEQAAQLRDEIRRLDEAHGETEPA